MTRTNKYLCAAASALLTLAVPAFAQSGPDGGAILLSSTIGGISSLDLLAAAQVDGGVSYYTPAAPTIGSPTVVDASSAPFSLGTFDVSAGDDLVFSGGEVLTADAGVTVADVYYAISPAPGGSGFDPIATSDGATGDVEGDNQYYDDTQAVDLLAGLPDGDYTLSVYFDDDGSPTTLGSSGSPIEVATFTVIPEPSSLATMLTSSILGGLYLLRRRRRMS